MMKRALFFILGSIFFGLGAVGIVVPGMPTTIFWILAALSYVKSSKKMYERIINSKRYGGPIRMYLEDRMISRKGKIISVTCMTVMSTLAIIFIPSLAAKLTIAGLMIFGDLFVGLLKTPEAVAEREARLAQQAGVER